MLVKVIDFYVLFASHAHLSRIKFPVSPPTLELNYWLLHIAAQEDCTRSTGWLLPWIEGRDSSLQGVPWVIPISPSQREGDGLEGGGGGVGGA